MAENTTATADKLIALYMQEAEHRCGAELLEELLDLVDGTVIAADHPAAESARAKLAAAILRELVGAGFASEAKAFLTLETAEREDATARYLASKAVA